MLSFLPRRSTTDRLEYTVDAECQVENLPQIYKQIFGFRRTGYFVEVGAMDGQSHSNTCGLADIGWNGIYVEATAEYATKCYHRHSKNSVQVLRRAISDHTGTLRLHRAGSTDRRIIPCYRTLIRLLDRVLTGGAFENRQPKICTNAP